jgi:hypothetical protein
MTVPEFALGREQVEHIDRTLADLYALNGEVRLRFANHWADDGENPALLAAALMGPLGDRHVFVNAEDDEAVDGMLRFGVATALARRQSNLTTFVGPAEHLDTQRLRLLWTPGSRGATQALFAADEEAAGVGAYGPMHATFVNPHLSSGADGHPDVVFLVRRWLNRRLLQDRGIAPPDVGSIVATVGLVVDEFLSNVQEHAGGGGVVEPDCLLRVSMASPGHVRISILDTGIGLDASLRSKLESAHSAEQRIADLLVGELPGWDAGRGIGLTRVASVLAGCGGRFSIATENLRVVQDGERTTTRADGFTLPGTVIDCSIPITAPQSC